MLQFRYILILAVITFFLIVSLGQAVTSDDGAALPDSPSSTKILKTTGVVKAIKGNVLYLENNKKYDLRNVKVTQSKVIKSVSTKKRIAEMFFINGVLKEVVIR